MNLVDISLFSETFLDVLSRADVDALPAYFGYPLLVTTPRGSIAYQSAPDILQAMTMVRDFYKKLDLKGFDAEPLELTLLTATSALIRTHMRTTDMQGKVIAEGHYSFVLRQEADGCKIISVVSDGPVALRIAEEYPQDSWKY